ncbi:protein KINESIN LIGHT CHAIN-RELATED 2 [Sesamum angolense]|uniref:Protein KINESIN LIGHT CHAIN-RELATED 2 n=1 Tax=Sesamum angolense TaxID=2727404 RepID=A0AAE1WGQ3_9LAMI|nr:protein KINESIN LIGHT CHAIN-RELATED 2 [Sesamum angolense]
MPEYIMDGSNGEIFAKEQGGHYVPRKVFIERSPRSPLTAHSPPLSTMSSESDSLDLAIDGGADTSIEQLYHNVCEMQSSDQSPSRRSFLSYGEESRIDSELRFLAGGDYGVAEIKKEVVPERNGGDSSPEGNKVYKHDSPGDKNKVKSSVIKSEAPRKVTLRSKTLNGRPPNGKQSVKGIKKIGTVSSMKIEKSPPKLQNGTEEHGESGYLGPYLLKQARDMIASGDNIQKALDLALRAMKSFEISASAKPNLDFVMCLHVVSALYCRLGRYTEAIPVLERSIDIPDIDLGHNHALAKFAGCMQLGDTYAMLGQIENSILFYTAAIQFDEAEKLCRKALDTHQANGSSASLEEAADRRLLGLICDSKGDYESALEHYVLASMAMAANGQNEEVAAIDCNVGDAYLAMARYDEAIFSYQKALNMFKSSKGENHPLVASVFVRLADLYNKIGKFSESKSYCENALRIYAKPTPGSPQKRSPAV